jgi:hypothetical protein
LAQNISVFLQGILISQPELLHLVVMDHVILNPFRHLITLS